MAYAIIPCEGKAELCEFGGKFDEGEGMSMGHPVKWKNPSGAIALGVASSLWAYDTKPFEVIKAVFRNYPNVDRIYADGLADGKTGWYNREDFK